MIILTVTAIPWNKVVLLAFDLMESTHGDDRSLYLFCLPFMFFGLFVMAAGISSLLAQLWAHNRSVKIRAQGVLQTHTHAMMQLTPSYKWTKYILLYCSTLLSAPYFSSVSQKPFPQHHAPFFHFNMFKYRSAYISTVRFIFCIFYFLTDTVPSLCSKADPVIFIHC